MPSAIRRSKEHENLLSLLVDKEKLFDNYTDLMCFAAAVAIKDRSSATLTDVDKSIKYETFKNQSLHEIINIISLIFSNNDLSEVDGTEGRINENISNFESISNAGLKKINNILSSKSSKLSLEVIVDLIQNQLIENTLEEPLINELDFE